MAFIFTSRSKRSRIVQMSVNKSSFILPDSISSSSAAFIDILTTWHSASSLGILSLSLRIMVFWSSSVSCSSSSLSVASHLLQTVFLDFRIHPNIWQLWGQISSRSRKLQHQFQFLFIIHHFISENHQKSLGTIVLLPWMPFKIYDCEKLLSTTSVTPFWL